MEDVPEHVDRDDMLVIVSLKRVWGGGGLCSGTCRLSCWSAFPLKLLFGQFLCAGDDDVKLKKQ